MKTYYFAGVREQDLRVVFTRLGKRRGLYARWRPQYSMWEVEFRGHGIHCVPCFIESQFVTESILRLKESVGRESGWKWLEFYKHRQWDGVPDLAAPAGYYTVALTGELEAQQARTRLPVLQWAKAA